MKKIISVVLSFALALTAMPAAAFAQDETQTATDISAVSIDAIADKEFTGKAITLSEDELIVKNGDDTLTMNTDFTAEYTDNINAGQATVTLTGQGNYTGTATANFNINAKAFDNHTFPDIEIPHQMVSEGSTAVQGTIVEWNDITLKENTDYTIAGDNSRTGNSTAAFTFKGNYSGTVTAPYRVIRENITDFNMEVTVPEGGIVFDGKAKMPEVTVKDGKKVLQNGVDYKLFFENNVNAGTASVRAQGDGEYGGEITKEFTIEKANLADAVLQLEKNTFTATGEAIEPNFTVTLGDYTVPADQFTTAYTDNTAIGTGKITLTAADRNFTGELSGTFTIKGKKGYIITGANNYTKYLNSKSFNLRARTNADADDFVYSSNNSKVARVSADGQVTIVGTGKAVITVKTTGTQTFERVEKNINVEVKPLKPAIKVSSPGRGKIKVTINKVEGATKYQVRYGRMGKYFSRYYTHKNDGKKTLSVTIDKRMRNKNYFVKVRSYKTLKDGTKVWGNWTTVRKVRTK